MPGSVPSGAIFRMSPRQHQTMLHRYPAGPDFTRIG